MYAYQVMLIKFIYTKILFAEDFIYIERTFKNLRKYANSLEHRIICHSVLNVAQVVSPKKAIHLHSELNRHDKE